MDLRWVKFQYGQLYSLLIFKVFGKSSDNVIGYYIICTIFNIVTAM